MDPPSVVLGFVEIDVCVEDVKVEGVERDERERLRRMTFSIGLAVWKSVPSSLHANPYASVPTGLSLSACSVAHPILQ